MAESVALTASEQELIGQVVRFAERRAENGVYINMLYSRSVGQQVVFVVAIGEQASVLQSLLMTAQDRQASGNAIEVVSNLDSVSVKDKF